MLAFLSILSEVVLPQVKDFEGVHYVQNEKSGSINFGFKGSAMALFPQIECTYFQFRFLANDQQILIHFRRYLDSILVSLQQQRQLQMQDYYSLHMAFHSKRDLVTSQRNQLEETQH